MFKKILIAEDMDFINFGVKSELEKLGIEKIEYVQYCDEALLKLKSATLNNDPYDLLISDLSFEQNGNEQKITGGEDLVKKVRIDFPNLKIAVFSVEDKPFTIQTLLNQYNVNAYVWKGRDGLSDLKKALKIIFSSNESFISPSVANALSNNNSIEISEYDIFIIECLSQGLLQGQISEKLKDLNWSPSSVSAVEKRLKFLKEHFNANNPAHLVAISKDLGLI
ncbi:response regulator [uncultured Lutibacter sp.]|uniref:response regulator n=1 Tax=uncultured Lutibacter sp. TaxID=437739 RepID=UPI0026262BC5|nr:response regulator [uncultured Lutibacter sp.]